MRRAEAWCVVVAALWVSGCRAADPVKRWQRTVEEFVQAEGNGDLSVLRRAGRTNAADDLRPALALVSAREVWARVAGRSAVCDVHGVLVGLRVIGGQPWYTFAVGVCAAAEGAADPHRARDRVVDVRVAAVSVDAGSFRWRVSEADAAALAQYLAIAAPPWPAAEVRMAFPRAGDDFVLAEEEFGVCERRSGACWRVTESQ
jgi:hypothetical protein